MAVYARLTNAALITGNRQLSSEFSLILLHSAKYLNQLPGPGLELPKQHSLLQPYAACYGLVGTFVMTFVGGYTVFLPLEGQWQVSDFLFSYTMVAVCPSLYVGWKLIHKTKIKKPSEVDLRQGLDEIEEYERNYVPQPATGIFERFLDKVFG